jgi:cyclopropane fatty-acyl-phospholipid synthase-like methyltransferase
MRDFWNDRYRSKVFAYGTMPNEFFASELKKLTPGKILLPAEGEGRNAIFAAQMGWDVVAFDFSESARDKALQLAQKNGVSVDYRIASYDDFVGDKLSFDCLALIYAHMPEGKRPNYHKKLISLLKPGGNIILEAYSKNQINNNTGGPKDLSFLFSKTDLENDFSDLRYLHVTEKQTILNEGEFHSGLSDVIQVLGVK